MSATSSGFGTLLPREQKFSELLNSSPELSNLQKLDSESAKWLKLLVAEDPRCRVATYKYGDLIQDTGRLLFIKDGEPYENTDLKNYLGIIVSGAAELCEEKALPGCVPAYRPTRLLKAGDFFGDFSIVDTALDERKGKKKTQTTAVLPDPEKSKSRPNESWQIYAGRRSLIVAAKVADSHIHKFKDHHDHEVKPHVFLNNAHKDSVTTVAFFHHQKMFEADHEFFKYLVHQAWRRSRTYRLGLNSYNFLQLLAFRRISIAKSEELKADAAKVNKPYNKYIAIKELTPIFVDAVHDALNRPLRRDLVFASRANTVSADCLAAFAAIGVSPDKIWVAADPDPDQLKEFYYPIDVSNFIISSISLLDDQIVKVQKPKARKGKSTEHLLSSKAVRALSTSREDKTDEAEKNISNRPRRFYIDLFCKVFEHHLQQMQSEYPFSVTCEDIEGLTGRMLVLKFTTE